MRQLRHATVHRSKRFDELPSCMAWVKGMNSANYLGHSNWRLPTTPSTDNGYGKRDLSKTTSGSVARLAHSVRCTTTNWALRRPIPLSLSQMDGRPIQQFRTFSLLVADERRASRLFHVFFQQRLPGRRYTPNFLYMLPMIPGKIPGTPPTTGTGLQVNPGGQPSMTRDKRHLDGERQISGPATRLACRPAPIPPPRLCA